MEARAIQGEVLVGRGVRVGRVVMGAGHQSGPLMFVTRRLDLKDYKLIRRCQAVICEEGGVADHVSVICRIIGIPIVLLAHATELLQPDEAVTVDAETGVIYRGKPNLPTHQESHEIQCLGEVVRRRSIGWQVSIVDFRDIATVNASDRTRSVQQFFVREELLWLKQERDPFKHVEDRGVEDTVRLLHGELIKCLRLLRTDQSLNYRSLDLRSDMQLSADKPVGAPESNPELGLHGIRRLLIEPDLLIAELKVVDLLYTQGFSNLVFSLPFITEARELEEVRLLARRYCSHHVKIGAFIETPAAITELPYMLSDGLASVYIGTKDLTQTILACDRNNANLRHIYNCRKRPVLTAISRIIETCETRNLPPVLFALFEDLAYFIEQYGSVETFSICRSEFERLLEAARVGR